MSNRLSVLAFLCSVLSLVLSAIVNLRAGSAADSALERRERALVTELKPRIHAVYRDFDIPVDPQADTANSLDELLQPLLDTVAGKSASH